MTNTKLFLLIGTSLSLIPNLTFAQCVATQDCATLGYTETSCSGGSGVKCPFGNKWACFKSESEICNDLGFTLTCTGSNQTGGTGKTCNGKYASCTCASGYAWNDSSQQCEDATANCTIGALYYADGTCSNDYISNKTLLGIVIYEKSTSENGWVMTHNQVATNIKWGTTTDIPELANYTSTPTDIQASCTNTDIITAYSDDSKYSAAWAAKNYQEGNKTWCLPSAGLLNTALRNSTNITKFNAAVYKIQDSAGVSAATILGNISSGYELVWSSSERSSGLAWYFYANTKGTFGLNYDLKNNTNDMYADSYFSVRPVFAF